MSFRSLAGTLSFAHLRGLGKSAKKADEETAAAAAAEDDAAEDEEMTAAEAETDDSEDAKDGKAKKAKNKEGDDTDPDDDGDDDAEDPDETDEDDEDAKKAKGKKASADFAKGRKFERARGTAIFSSPAAAKNLELAALLAFDPKYAELSGAAARAVLETAPKSASGSLNDRMARTTQTRIPPGGSPDKKSAAAIAASWDAAFAPYQPSK